MTNNNIETDEEIEINGDGYSCCFNDWALNKNIKNDLGLLMIISSLTASKGYCWASNKYLAKLFEIDEVSVSRKIKNLEKEGIITIEYEKVGNVITKRIIRLTKMFITVNKNVNDTVNKNVKDNNTRNNNNTNNNNNNICDKNHLLVAETIKGIVESKSSKQINNRVLNGWIDEIRKLESVDKVPIEKIVSVAKWYAIHFNDNKYIPVVESGKSFRKKFVKLEQAIARQQPLQSKTKLEKFNEMSWIFEAEADKNNGKLSKETVDLMHNMFGE